MHSERFTCDECGSVHLDLPEWVEMGKRHVCLTCGKAFPSSCLDGSVAGNPLARAC